MAENRRDARRHDVRFRHDDRDMLLCGGASLAKREALAGEGVAVGAGRVGRLRRVDESSVMRVPPASAVLEVVSVLQQRFGDVVEREDGAVDDDGAEREDPEGRAEAARVAQRDALRGFLDRRQLRRGVVLQLLAHLLVPPPPLRPPDRARVVAIDEAERKRRRPAAQADQRAKPQRHADRGHARYRGTDRVVHNRSKARE
mmetsp:Transcript_26369/g.57770  ORF Transcript_26369/g.57770 Transcript_26369/m.57770 type:complete len:201 (+) Transcript_26369:358-960(+)